MTNYEIWKALNVAIDKDEYGGEFSPIDYEALAKQVNLYFLNKKMEELYSIIRPGQVLNETILSSKLVRGLIVRETITPTTGVINLSTQPANTYGYLVSMTATYSTKIRSIELLSHDEFERRVMSLTGKPISMYPIAIIDGNNLRIYPTNITSVNFTYVKIPTNPIFDYYVDSNDNIVYMAAGATNVSIPSGATYSDGTAGATTKNSRTVEWGFDAIYHGEIFNEMLSLLSNRVKDQGSLMYAENKINKEESR